MKLAGRILQARCRQRVVCLALTCAFTTILLHGSLSGQAYASDRDTPAYMIYVDPVTGKYTTRPPAEHNLTEKSPADSAVTSASNNPATGGNAVMGKTGSSADRTSMTAPLTAVLMLVSVALFSLLFRGNRNP